VAAISAALKAAAHTARATASGAALVKVDEHAELAKARRALDFPKTRTAAGPRISDGGGFAAGKAAGANLNQKTQLGTGGTRLLGA
jgi:hypothetical protein